MDSFKTISNENKGEISQDTVIKIYHKNAKGYYKDSIIGTVNELIAELRNYEPGSIVQISGGYDPDNDTSDYKINILDIKPMTIKEVIDAEREEMEIAKQRTLDEEKKENEVQLLKAKLTDSDINIIRNNKIKFGVY